MKMMEADKQEKYILLNNDSDLEEFDKSKVSLMHSTGKRKLLSRSHKTKKFSPCDQPQWLCHVFFVLLIFMSQILLSFFVLKIHQDLSILKQKGASAQMKASFNIANEQTDVKTISSRKEQTESEFKDLNQQGIACTETLISRNTEKQSTSAEKNETGISKDKSQEVSCLFECVYKLNMSTTLELHEMKGKIIQLHNHMCNLSDQFLSMETVMNSLFYTVNSQQLQNPVDSKMNAFEKRLANVTTTLNNLQNRLEEELGDVFLQLSELKDNLYALDNTLNLSSVLYASPTQSFQEKEKKVYTPWLPYVTSSQIYDTSAVPETTSQDSKDEGNSKMLDEKPKITISFIKNLTDLQVFFYGADNNANGYLTYSEIESLLGEETPEQEQLELFDADDNKMYSYLELIRAFGLTE